MLVWVTWLLWGNCEHNIESDLRRKIAPHQGSIPGHLALWESAVGCTHGYYFNVALYSNLIIYCVLPCIRSMHYVLGRVKEPISIHLPNLSTPLEAWHWNVESDLWRMIAPRQGSIPGYPALWAGTVGSPHSSTHGYYLTMLFALCSILPTYLVLPIWVKCMMYWCLSVMHNVLWEG